MRDACDDVEPLCSAWLDGMLDDRDRARVAAHLRGCRACRDEVDGLRRVRDLLGNLPPRRTPADLELVPAAPSTPPRSPVPATAPGWSGSQRVAAGLAVVVGLVGGAAFALGDQPGPGDRVVTVPVDRYVADHLVHTVGGPLSTPLVTDGGP